MGRHGTPCLPGCASQGHGSCLRPRHGPMGRFPCRAGPRSTTRITGRASLGPVTLCIHKQITVSHSQNFLYIQIHRNIHSFIYSQNRSPNVRYIHRSQFHTFTESKSKCPIDRYIHSPIEISNSKLQSRQITEITKMSCLVQ